MKHLIYKVSYTRYQVPFYLLWVETLLKPCKILKYYEHIEGQQMALESNGYHKMSN